jgi:hypothetical protein
MPTTIHRHSLYPVQSNSLDSQSPSTPAKHHVSTDQFPPRMRACLNTHKILSSRSRRTQAMRQHHQAVHPISSAVRLHTSQVSTCRLPIRGQEPGMGLLLVRKDVECRWAVQLCHDWRGRHVSVRAYLLQVVYAV